MMTRGDYDHSPGATLPHRSFTEPAVVALCSMIGWATDSTADFPIIHISHFAGAASPCTCGAFVADLQHAAPEPRRYFGNIACHIAIGKPLLAEHGPHILPVSHFDTGQPKALSEMSDVFGQSTCSCHVLGVTCCAETRGGTVDYTAGRFHFAQSR